MSYDFHSPGTVAQPHATIASMDLHTPSSYDLEAIPSASSDD